MKDAQLPEPALAATHSLMDRMVTGIRVKLQIAVLLAGAATMAGCITVNAPEDAIVIELNINIKQEVIYRLAEDAGNTIEENADIF